MKRCVNVTPTDGVPILAEADMLVVEGTLAGCVAAYNSARAGHKTVLAVTGCSVPHEIVTCRRPWVTKENLSCLPAPFKEAFESSIEHTLSDGMSLMNLTRASIAVEDLLMDAGVHLFYGMTPCGVAVAESRAVSSVIFGGKFGLQAVSAGRIVDATQTTVIPRLAGCSHDIHQETHIVARISAKVAVADGEHANKIDTPQGIQACPTAWPQEDAIEVADCSSLVGGRFQIYGTYAEFVLRLSVNPDDPIDQAHLSVEARKQLVDIGCQATAAREAEGKPPLYIHRYSGALLCDPLVRVNACPPNVQLLGPSDDVDPYESVKAVAAIDTSPSANRAKPAQVKVVTQPCEAESTGLQLCFGDKTQSDHKIALDAISIPVIADADVIVAGGGTSGVPAALAAAQAGARVVLIEQHADVGGTQTVGGVGNYWFGRETPFQLACDEQYSVWSDRSGMAREIAMLKCLTDAGVTVLAPSTLLGVVRDGDHLTGVAIATENGIAVVAGKTVIDATGDADIAAWAGVPYEFGNGRDAWTIWASFANFNVEKRTASRQYESSADVSDPQDFVRTIVRGRRRQGMWSRFAHDMPQLYVAPRETRRIHGRARITYGGILAGETFPDVMTVCDSNFDIKGVASSDLIYCGVMWGWKAHIRYLAAIPFRAIQPANIDNLMIVGRSYCASHDAQSLARMQRDMTSLGAGAGIAAARSVKQSIPIADLDVQSLQQEWVSLGTLLPEDRQKYGAQSEAYGETDAKQDIDQLFEDGEVSAHHLARLASSKVSIQPLRSTFEQTDEQTFKTYAARLLCYLGDDTGVDYLIEQIEQQTKDGLPIAPARTLALPPEHGWAPEPAYSLYAIGLVDRGNDLIDLLEKIAMAVEDSAEAFDKKDASPFEYIRTICAVADRNPSAEMIRPLEVLYQKSSIRNLAMPVGGDTRQILEPSFERRAYCELCVARAMARCGDARGYDLLIQYANDVRRPLARSAADELCDLTGETDWQKAIARRTNGYACKPYTSRID